MKMIFLTNLDVIEAGHIINWLAVMNSMKIDKLLAVFLGVITIGIFPSITWSSSSYTLMKTFIIESWGNGAPQLEITLPKSWDYKKHKGADFDVHWFTDKNTNENIGFYIGHHPNFKKFPDAKSDHQHVGKKETIFYSENRGEIIFSQTIIRGIFKGYAGPGVDELILHIMVNSHSDEFKIKAFQYLETLKIRNKSG